MAAVQIGGRSVGGPPGTHERQADEDLAQASQAVSQGHMRDILLQIKSDACASDSRREQNEAHFLRGRCSGGQSCIVPEEAEEAGKLFCNIGPRAVADRSAAQPLACSGTLEVQGAGRVSARRSPSTGEVSDSMASAQSSTGESALSVCTPVNTSA